MITAYDSATASHRIDAASGAVTLPQGTLWIDLVDPSEDDDTRIELATGA